MRRIPLVSDGTFFGKPIQIGCDLLCSKAWGFERPKVYLSCNEDDYAYLSDVELGVAPADPGTTEGDEGMPSFGGYPTVAEAMTRAFLAYRKVTKHKT